MDVRCIQCEAVLPTKVIKNVLYITTACEQCGWVAPIDKVQFIEENNTPYADVVLVWPCKAKSK